MRHHTLVSPATLGDIGQEEEEIEVEPWPEQEPVRVPATPTRVPEEVPA